MAKDTWIKAGDTIEVIRTAVAGRPTRYLSKGTLAEVLEVTPASQTHRDKLALKVRVDDVVWDLWEDDVELVEFEENPVAKDVPVLEEIRDLLVEIRDAVTPTQYESNVRVNPTAFDDEALKRAAELAAYWHLVQK